MHEDCLRNARILIVDDEQAMLRLLEHVLARAGYTNVTTTSDSRDAVGLCERIDPDLIVLDLHMPGLDGFAVLRQLRHRMSAETYLPVLVLTADTTTEAKREALALGGKDFLHKPFDQVEALQRIGNLLQTRLLYRRLRDHTHQLEAKVRARTAESEQLQLDILERLALAAEYRDDATGEHTRRVGRTAALLGTALGLPDADVELLRRAAPLHDIGKIGVPDSVLLKPGRLTPAEFAVVKSHTTIGARLLAGGRFPLLQMAEQIALTHHEHWDGSGYTPGLEGDNIPLCGRIVAVADVFDALTHSRIYKPAWPVDEAVSEILRQSGRRFDPQVVAAFHEVVRQEDLMRLELGALN